MVMPKRQWRWSRARVEQAQKAGELHFSKDKDGNWAISSKQYLRDEDGQRETKFFSVIDDVYTQHGTNEIVDLFGDAQVFPFPKPSSLIVKLAQFATKSDDIVLDFFAGSGSTGHGIMDLNRQDGGQRKFILVQLPEPTGQAQFKTVADITKERLRRVSKRMDSESAKGGLLTPEKTDIGFDVFKLSASNFKAWDGNAPKDATTLGEQLSLHTQHVQRGRTAADILYEILLKSGFPLTSPVDKCQLAGKEIFAVAGGMMLICLERELTLDVIRAMAETKPERAVCLDEGFAGNDQLKTNAVQTFKAKGIVFRTV